MDIEEFLAAQRESGLLDSAGVFTVAVEKAREKLGKFQLDDPCFYLLKLVQAAVEGGARRLDLRTTRKKLALWWDAPSEPFGFERLLEALRNPLEIAPGPLKSLALGFNASLFSRPLQVSLVWWGQERALAAVARGSEVAMVAAPPRPAEVSNSGNLYMLSVAKEQPGWFESATSGELETVKKHCCYGGIDFFIDGRRLPPQRLPEVRHDTWLVGYSDSFYLVERYDSDPEGVLRVGGPRRSGYRLGTNGWLRKGRDADTFLLQPTRPEPFGEIRCREAYGLPLGLRGPDKLILVHHGVKVCSVTINSNGAGAVAVLPAEGLTFDLSGFSVIRDGAFHDLELKANQIWRAMATAARQEVPHLTATLTEKERGANEEKRSQSLTCSVLGCCGTAILLPNFHFISSDIGVVLSMLALAGGAYAPYARTPPDPHQRLREAVAHRLDQLSEHWPRG